MDTLKICVCTRENGVCVLAHEIPVAAARPKRCSVIHLRATTAREKESETEKTTTGEKNYIAIVKAMISTHVFAAISARSALSARGRCHRPNTFAYCYCFCLLFFIFLSISPKKDNFQRSNSILWRLVPRLYALCMRVCVCVRMCDGYLYVCVCEYVCV